MARIGFDAGVVTSGEAFAMHLSCLQITSFRSLEDVGLVGEPQPRGSGADPLSRVQPRRMAVHEPSHSPM
jgi:hypothetical protein